MLREELLKLREDLRQLDFDVLKAAIRGEVVPQDLSHDVTIRCLVSGIRHHDGFAEELRGKTQHESVIRALNARAIMSNRLPEPHPPARELPYCFWYPDLPKEQTLRHLLKTYPNPLMLYQVARACAAGGYTDLYDELDVLPDVAIAEEARDNKVSGKEIYDRIMSARARYRVMDDYNCTVSFFPKPGAFLNGDTCVRSTLDKRLAISRDLYPPSFDITEDWNLGAEGSHPGTRPIPDDVVSLLWNPLPFDLPTVDKDLLILMAAYSGNVDRYARLRRPTMIQGEAQCIVRGIYHDTFFAKWCSKQPELERFRKFAYARFIMNDDLNWTEDIDASLPQADLPYTIWYPKLASPETYMELAQRVPILKQAAAHAMIVAKDFDRFVELQPKINNLLYEEVQIQGCYDNFMGYVKEHVSPESIAQWDYFSEIPDVDEVAKDEALIWTEMKPSTPTPLEEVTLDSVGVWNRRTAHSEEQNVADIINFVSSFPRKSRGSGRGGRGGRGRGRGR
ncbi:hypothetical protein CEP51_001473 [Fusarium floridanum]|uniref:Uncharacterized protein n=1 Tax=Fusarium floridanum TaxID=1325733 RepID=A0A428SGK2_9HYPO|nr:hypothetical protein CEP51_001473 [Fusarium floridanum]